MLSWSKHPRSPLSSPRIPTFASSDAIAPVLALLAGVGVSLALFHYTISEEQAQSRLNFRLLAEESISSIENRITENSTTVRAIASYFSASDRVQRRGFSAFVSPFIARNKSIQALQWVPYVKDADRGDYEAQARRDGLADFHFREWKQPHISRIAGKRPDYFVVYYNEPSAPNRAVTGLDNGSEPVRRRVLLESAQSGGETYSPPVVLMQGKASQKGYLVYLPVYDSAAVPRTPEGRLSHLKGFATGVFLMDAMVRSALGKRNDQMIYLEIVDVTDPRREKPLGSVGTPGPATGGMSCDRVCSFGNREWRFHLVPGRAYPLPSQISAWARLAFCLILTCLVFVVLIHRSTATRMLRESEQKHRLLLERLHSGVLVHAPDMSVMFSNPEARRILRVTDEQLSGSSPEELGWRFIRCDGSPMPTEELPARLIISTKAPLEGMIVGMDRPATRDQVWVLVSGYPMFNPDYTVHSAIITFVDITERKEYEGLLDYQAHHDALTDLPNRLLFSKQLADVVADHGRQSKQCAVLFIDLDNFKMVNDTMGHQVGDALLVEIAARLGSSMREGDTLARMGGDEFTVLLKDLRSNDDAAVVAERMLEHVSAPIQIGEHKLVIGASVGVSTFPENAFDADGLLKAADAAMYRAKALGRNNCQFFSEELSRANMARVELERDLRLAIERDELKVYYQPIVDVQTMAVTGAEALLRWDHPEKGMISPSLFVPVAEETGLILQMGRKVLETACKQCKSWHDEGYWGFEMSVNVSPMQLRHESLPLGVLDILDYTRLSPQSLNLEITETMLARNEYGEIDVLARLRELGIKTCLDDFGIGYSSLSRLKDLPIMHMKVDGSFIRDIQHSANDRAMTESIVAMAHNLGIKVTAEWIENEEQMATVRSLGCDYAQGYLISPALPAEVFGQFIREWTGSRGKADAA